MRQWVSLGFAVCVASAVLSGSPPALAEGFAYEREQLSLVLKQLESIEQLAKRSESALPAEPASRYRFDYAQLHQDIERVRQGIAAYLSPERSQPRVPAPIPPINAAYRQDRSAAGKP